VPFVFQDGNVVEEDEGGEGDDGGAGKGQKGGKGEGGKGGAGKAGRGSKGGSVANADLQKAMKDKIRKERDAAKVIALLFSVSSSRNFLFTGIFHDVHCLYIFTFISFFSFMRPHLVYASRLLTPKKWQRASSTKSTLKRKRRRSRTALEKEKGNRRRKTHTREVGSTVLDEYTRYSTVLTIK